MFCGGGSRCIVFVQALVELEATGCLTDVREYWGTSAGALLALILAINPSPRMIQPIVEETKFHRFRDMDPRNLLSFQSTWGLDDGTSLVTELARVAELIASPNITMKDLPSLHIVVADVTARETLVLSGKTHPNLRAVDAVRASMSIPFLYKPFKDPVTGHHWIDGALRANFAWDLLPSDEERRNTMGFCFLQSPPTHMTLEKYIFSMIHFDEPRKLIQLQQSWSSHILWFAHPPFPSWYTRVNEEDIRMLNEAGRRVAQEWILKQSLPSRIEESPPLSVLPHTQPSSSHPDSTVGSSGIPGLTSSHRMEYPSPPVSLPPRLSRRWSV